MNTSQGSQTCLVQRRISELHSASDTAFDSRSEFAFGALTAFDSFSAAFSLTQPLEPNRWQHTRGLACTHPNTFQQSRSQDAPSPAASFKFPAHFKAISRALNSFQAWHSGFLCESLNKTRESLSHATQSTEILSIFDSFVNKSFLTFTGIHDNGGST